jgi:hypothetical protein
VSCTATDVAGNATTKKFNVEVQDTTPPEITVPTDITEEATSAAGASVSFTATANDIVDGETAAVCTPASGATFALGTTTVNCTKTDNAGNEATPKSFQVKVQDTTAPVVTVPADILREATGPLGAMVAYSASAQDIVDGTMTPACAPASGSTFPITTTVVQCSVTDNAGNTGSAAFSVTVQDTTAPAVTVPADIARFATSSAGADVTFASSALDIVDGAISPSCTPDSGNTFALGATTVTCTATDLHGNTGQKSFTITVTYSWSGFLQPINQDNSSVFKLGSTVPVKFQLTGPSAGITDAVARLYIAKVSNGVVGSYVEAASTAAATTGNLFRVGDGQYIFNWGTKGQTTGTYLVRADTGDGVLRTVYVSLR